jgi:hypothetical protein
LISVVPDGKIKQGTGAFVMIKAPIPPAITAYPVIVAMADLGNMSPIVEKRLADHAW